MKQKNLYEEELYSKMKLVKKQNQLNPNILLSASYLEGPMSQWTLRK